MFTRITQFGVSLLAFAALMYLLLGPHGYAVQYIGGLTNGDDLCLVEQHYTGDGDGGSYVNYRLFVLDMKTGERKLRLPVDSPEILCVKENSVVFFIWNYAEEYDLKTGEKINEWNKENGFEKFPELSVGISDINRSTGAYDFENKGWLTVTAKNGHQYIYNLLTDELKEEKFVPHVVPTYNVDDHEIRFNDSTDNKYWRYNFEDKTGELKQLVFHDKDYAETILEGEYLRPEMVSVHPELGLFVFKHYTSTDYNASIHTGVGFDHQIKWRLSQADLQTSDNFTNQPLPGITIPFGDQLIATFGGQAICINVSDGNVVWKSVQ